MAEWVKLHTDILGDHKLMRAARKGAVGLEYTPWLFAFARTANDDGRLTVNGQPAEPDDLLTLIPCSTLDRLTACLASLTECGVLAPDADGALRFTKWESRQAKPSGTPSAVLERVHKHRDKKRVYAVVRETPSISETVTPVTPEVVCQGNATEEEEEGEGEEENNNKPASAGSVAMTVHSHRNGNGNGNGERRSQQRGLPAVIDRGKHAIAELLAMGAHEAETDRQRAAMVSLVFAYWAATLKHPSALQDRKRERLIAQRLQENRHDVSELLFVVDGTRRDKNLMGENEKNRKYDGIETIFRDRGQVERLAALGGYIEGKEHRMLARMTASV